MHLKKALPFLFLMSFFSPLYSWAAAEANPAAQSFFEEALQLRESGQLSQAQKNLQKAIALDVKNANYHFEMANLYAVLHDNWYRRSKSKQMQETLDAAARSLQQAVMLDPDFMAAYYNLGVVYKKQEKFEAAREEFKKVLEIDPRQFSAYMQIGATYENQGFFEDAEDAYLKGKTLHINHPEIDGALQDLDRNRRIAEAQARQRDEAQRMMRYHTSFRHYSAESAAARYQREDYNQAADQADAVAFLPYLGAWLAEQFMNLRDA